MGLIDDTLQSVGSLINQPYNLLNQTSSNLNNLKKDNLESDEAKEKHEEHSSQTGKSSAKQSSDQNAKAQANYHNKSVAVDVSLKSTVLDVLHEGLSQHAQKSGLPEHEQKEFVTEHLQNFAQTVGRGAEKLLNTAGNLQLLQVPTPIVTVKHEGNGGKAEVELGGETLKDLNVRLNAGNSNGNNGLRLNFGTNTNVEAHHEHAEHAENGHSDADVHLSLQFGINRSTTQRAVIEARMQALENNQTTLGNFKLPPPVPQRSDDGTIHLPNLPNLPVDLPKTPVYPIYQPITQQTGDGNPHLPANMPANMPHESPTSPNYPIYQPIQTQQIHEIKDTILNKIGDILQRIIGANGETGGSEQTSRRGGITSKTGEIEGEESADDESPKGTLEKIIYSGGKREGGEQNEQTEQDDALFASAFGVSSHSGESSRKAHGDALLMNFVNFGGAETPVKLDPKVFMASLLKVLQSGSEAGFNTLQSVASKDLPHATFESIKQVSAKLDADGTKHLVYGVVTLNVMTREIIERLAHVSSNTHAGLSDDARASLQKAHNSLRDHLTSKDLVGALGDIKNSPVSISGSNYNFLPEVHEALNALRDARSRIMSETTHVKNDGSSVNPQRIFSVEADTLLEVTRRVEDYLKIK